MMAPQTKGPTVTSLKALKFQRINKFEQLRVNVRKREIAYFEKAPVSVANDDRFEKLSHPVEKDDVDFLRRLIVSQLDQDSGRTLEEIVFEAPAVYVRRAA
jgi:hypothetical protein